jgi:rRNA-processing protein FCF1
VFALLNASAIESIVDCVVFCRLLLHRCFQVVQDHGQRASTLLADCYSHECSIVDTSDRDLRDRFIQRGLSLGMKLFELTYFLI